MIRIITDSASDILPAEAELLGVQVIPLNVTFEDGTVVRDGLDMTPQEYYTRLPQCGKLPTTSQPSPELFESAYRDAIAAGDTVIGLFLSSQLSGTFQSARMAVDMAEATEEQVHLVDTETVCLAEALLVRLAVRLRDAGKSAAEILSAVEHAKQHLHLVAVIDDLTYLRKGGRLPAAVAIAGGMLGIKPLITIKEGKVAMAGKARGLPGAYVTLFKQIDALGGIAPGSEAVAAYTSSAREVEPIETYFTNNLHREAPLARRIGCVIGTHTGPGAFGFAFFDAALDPALCTAAESAPEVSQ
jgi:DegV family protein with EDD domain